MSEPESVIPVFPLPNVVLFPRLQLPLHIFEPRYRQMVRDAVAGEKLIGMALLRGDWEKEYYGNPEIFPVGCAGRIVGMTPLADGRCNILLHGWKEYDVAEEILDRTPYRLARVVFRDEPVPLEPAALGRVKAEVLGLARRILEPESPLLELLDDPSIDGAAWVNLCCFALDVATLEKQSLLEAKSAADRAARLVEVMRFRAAERQAPFHSLRGSKREGKLPH